MSIVPMSDILIPARRGGYAVGAFEVWNLESVQAVVAAAEGLSQPVILQVGPYEADYAGLEDISHIAFFHARRAIVPVAIHLDHGDTLERVMQCISCGFTSVMLDVSHSPYAENVAATKEVVRVAHASRAIILNLKQTHPAQLSRCQCCSTKKGIRRWPTRLTTSTA